MKEIYRLRVIIVLALIVVILSILKIKYGWKEENGLIIPANTTPTITVTPTETATAAAILKVDETKYPLWDRLPYPGDGFVVKRYTAAKTLLVELDGASTLSATKAINVWLKGFGDAGKGHKLEFGE
jgi:hypothetical protein